MQLNESVEDKIMAEYSLDWDIHKDRFPSLHAHTTKKVIVNSFQCLNLKY